MGLQGWKNTKNIVTDLIDYSKNKFTFSLKPIQTLSLDLKPAKIISIFTFEFYRLHPHLKVLLRKLPFWSRSIFPPNRQFPTYEAFPDTTRVLLQRKCVPQKKHPEPRSPVLATNFFSVALIHWCSSLFSFLPPPPWWLWSCIVKIICCSNIKVSVSACKRKDVMEAAEQASAPKKPRLVFTDLQRRTLQAIFKVQPKTRLSSAPLLVSLNVSKHEINLISGNSCIKI